MHFGDRRLGSVGMVSMLPDMALVATGMALAFKIRREARVALTFFGEGSTANGQWHEAMNLAGVQRLPVVFVLENNQFAYSTPNDLEFAVDPVERAATYGFPGIRVDGNDVEAVFEAARAAVDRARDGGGPTLIECETMRMHGHGAHDDMSYVPDSLRSEWARRDPIERYAERLVADLGFRPDELEATRNEVTALVAECARRALESPMPDAETAAEGVFAEEWSPLGDGQAPWSRWSGDGAQGGNGRAANGNGSAAHAERRAA
jgi:pyruvate dehydrogenase E1 component alpha subunit